MKGKHLKRAEKGAMARRLVYYCVAVITVAAVWAMILKTIKPDIDLTDVLDFIKWAFGGELLFLLVKRVLAKPTDEAPTETPTETEAEG